MSENLGVVGGDGIVTQCDGGAVRGIGGRLLDLAGRVLEAALVSTNGGGGDLMPPATALPLMGVAS